MHKQKQVENRGDNLRHGEVLQIPKFSTNIIYYKRQLTVFDNESVYATTNNNLYCFCMEDDQLEIRLDNRQAPILKKRWECIYVKARKCSFHDLIRASYQMAQIQEIYDEPINTSYIHQINFKKSQRAVQKKEEICCSGNDSNNIKT